MLYYIKERLYFITFSLLTIGKLCQHKEPVTLCRSSSCNIKSLILWVGTNPALFLATTYWMNAHWERWIIVQGSPSISQVDTCTALCKIRNLWGVEGAFPNGTLLGILKNTAKQTEFLLSPQECFHFSVSVYLTL